MKAKLVLIAGKADKGEVRLKLPTIVGRNKDAGLMIAHNTVSRRHCEIFEKAGALYVRDMGSLNGTLVDGQPIQETALQPGHTLTIGPLTFRAEYEPVDAFIEGDAPQETSAATVEAATAEPATEEPVTENDAEDVLASDVALDAPDDLDMSALSADLVAAEPPGESASSAQDGSSPQSTASGDTLDAIDLSDIELDDIASADTAEPVELELDDAEGDGDLGLPSLVDLVDDPGLDSISDEEVDVAEPAAASPKPTATKATTEVAETDEVKLESLSGEDDLELDFTLEDDSPGAAGDLSTNDPTGSKKSTDASDDLLGEIDLGGDSSLSFDLADDLGEAGDVGNSAALSAGAASGAEPASGAMDDAELSMELDDVSLDDLALEDVSLDDIALEEPSAANASPIDNGDVEEELTFELAEPEPSAKDAGSPAKNGAGESKKPVSNGHKDEEEGEDLSQFLKELGM